MPCLQDVGVWVRLQARSFRLPCQSNRHPWRNQGQPNDWGDVPVEIPLTCKPTPKRVMQCPARGNSNTIGSPKACDVEITKRAQAPYPPTRHWTDMETRLLFEVTLCQVPGLCKGVHQRFARWPHQRVHMMVSQTAQHS